MCRQSSSLDLDHVHLVEAEKSIRVDIGENFSQYQAVMSRLAVLDATVWIMASF